MSHPYQYVVLRYVPRVDRGECVNVGVVVHSQSAGVLRCGFHLDQARITALAPDADLEGLVDLVERMRREDGVTRTLLCPIAHADVAAHRGWTPLHAAV